MTGPALETISHQTLKELAKAGSVRGACLVGQRGGFGVVVRYGVVERALSSTRGQVRLFASLDTAVPYLKQLGLDRFEVDATGYEPGRLRKPRPDRAEALRKTRTRPKQEQLI
jgi:hypothetical protein